MTLDQLLEMQLMGTAPKPSIMSAVLSVRYPPSLGLEGVAGLSTIFRHNAEIISAFEQHTILRHALGLFLFFDDRKEAIDVALQLNNEHLCLGLGWGGRLQTHR